MRIQAQARAVKKGEESEWLGEGKARVTEEGASEEDARTRESKAEKGKGQAEEPGEAKEEEWRARALTTLSVCVYARCQLADRGDHRPRSILRHRQGHKQTDSRACTDKRG
eukprot:3231357-Pleurochrysis_carterae.AAC.3